MFVAFVSNIVILTKMKSHGYKLINYAFSVAVYDLLPPLDQFVDAVPPLHQRQATSTWWCSPIRPNPGPIDPCSVCSRRVTASTISLFPDIPPL